MQRVVDTMRALGYIDDTRGKKILECEGKIHSGDFAMGVPGLFLCR